nr:hypothetical protein [Tanacetum cinerariifolium]
MLQNITIFRFKTMSNKEHEKRHRYRHSRCPRPSPSVFSRIKHDRSRSLRQKSRDKEGDMFKRLGSGGKSVSARSDSYDRHTHSRYTKALSESEDSGGGHWKSRSKKKKSSGEEDDLSHPWVCEEIDPFTPRIRYFDFQKTRMPSHIKTYDRGEDPEDHLNIFQAAAKTERWAMPTRCHMFNSTLTGNARKKCIKDPIEIHNIKQRGGESTEDFVKRYKLESMDVKGAQECIRIYGFVHGITNPELIKRLHDKIPKTVDEIMRVTTSFLGGKWQPRIMSERSRSHHENTKKVIRSKISKKEGFETSNDLKGSRIGNEEHSTLAWMNFVVVRSPSPYNGIIRRPGVRKIQAVSSTAHAMLNLSVEGGVITLKSSRLVPMECAMVSGPEGALLATKPAMEERIKVAINPEYPKQTIMIGYTLTEEGRSKLCDLLQQNLDTHTKAITKYKWQKRIKKKKTFIISQGIYCYTKMPFGLRNAGAAYQRLVDKAFHKQIGKNLEVYVDDLVIKSHKENEIVKDVEEMFKTLREINMKLNPKKCTFGVEEGMFLGYAVNTKGIKVCPDKSIKRPEDKLYTNGVISIGFGTCQLHSRATRRGLSRYSDGSGRRAPEPEILFTDGSSCTDGFGAGLILTNPEGTEFTYSLSFSFDATNNEAEYEALIVGLRIAEQMGVKNLQANVDSRLVANQVNGEYVAKETDMIQYLEKVRTRTKSFKAFSIKQIPRNENKKAVVEEEGDTWMTPIFRYLAEGTLPTDVKKARAVRRKSWRFAVINETLYKKSFLGPWLRCVGPLQANYVLREIHEGSCSMHTGTGKVKFLIVAIDYFTKWIEAKLVAIITGNQIKKFVWDNIVCRFGLPREIISDNGKQFRDDTLKDWCEKLCICQHFASVKHPQTNCLVKRANHSLGEVIKARLDARSKNWIEELSHVLWAHRTMIKTSNEDIPFSLTYGTEVFIPAEIGRPTLRTAKVDLVQNNEALGINLDLLEERREQAAIRGAKKQSKNGEVL